MAGPKVTMIGAGSVVFARTLMSDILSFPELAGSHVALHDIDPERLETAEKMVRAVAPGSILLNYTNPMAMLCLAVERAGGVPVVGLCHSVQGTARQLAEYVDVPADEVTYKVAGINHMAWFLELCRRDGEDLYPRLWAALDDPLVFGLDKVRFEMMRRLGYFVTESSEHMSEYLPYFIKRDELIERFDIPIDEYIRRSERNLNRAEQERERLDRGETVEVRRSHESGGSQPFIPDRTMPRTKWRCATKKIKTHGTVNVTDAAIRRCCVGSPPSP